MNSVCLIVAFDSEVRVRKRRHCINDKLILYSSDTLLFCDIFVRSKSASHSSLKNTK
jgi:hypothetical protein